MLAKDHTDGLLMPGSLRANSTTRHIRNSSAARSEHPAAATGGGSQAVPSKFAHLGLRSASDGSGRSQVDLALMDAITARLDGLERPHGHSQSDVS